MASVDDLNKEIIKALRLYADDIQEGIEKESKAIAMNGIKRLKSISPNRTGRYARSWKVKKVKGSYVIYNKDRYRLTHLLEKPHKKRGGKGFTVPEKHIEIVEQESISKFIDSIEKLVQG